ncbi:hypothetical protein, partial [Mycobacterium tuberculosis]
KGDNSRVNKNTILESLNVTFYEHVIPMKSNEGASISKRIHEPEGSIDITTIDSQSKEVENEEPRRSKRPCIEKTFGPDFVTYMLESEPRTHQEAVSSTDGPL